MINLISSNIRLRIILVFLGIMLGSPSVALTVSCDRKTGTHSAWKNPAHFRSWFPNKISFNTNTMTKETKSKKISHKKYWRIKSTKLYITVVSRTSQGSLATRLYRLQPNKSLYSDMRTTRWNGVQGISYKCNKGSAEVIRALKSGSQTSSSSSTTYSTTTLSNALKGWTNAGICYQATSNLGSQKRWRYSSNGVYVKEAKRRGLSCGVVSEDVGVKTAFNRFVSNQRISIQKALTDLGYYKSAIDGKYGPSTEAAIIKYLDFKQPHLRGKTKSFTAIFYFLKRLDSSSSTTYSTTTLAESLKSWSSSALCNRATTTSFSGSNLKSQKKWSNYDFHAAYVNEAKRRGLSCGVVSENVGVKIAFSKFDSNGRISIQKALTDLGYYKSAIDGQYGPSTDLAIVKYLEFKQPHLRGKTKSFSATLTFLKSLVAEQVQSNSLAVIKKDENTKETILEAELLISDVEEFLKSGTGTFDLSFAKKYAPVRGLSKDVWNPSLEAKFLDFKKYVYSNESFQKYSEVQKQNREAAFNKALEDSKLSLLTLNELLVEWLKVNLVHENSSDVYDEIERNNKVLEGNDFAEIEKKILTAKAWADKLNLDQKTLSVETENADMLQVTKTAFNSFDSNGRLNIQKSLTDLGFYKLGIDGVFNTATHLSIISYLSSKGLEDVIDPEPVIQSLSILVASVLDSNTLSVATTKVSIQDELNAAVILLRDVREYISNGIGSFGFEFVSKYNLIKNINGGSWSTEDKLNFDKFKEYIYQNADFRSYEGEQKNIREQKLLFSLTDLKGQLEEHNGLLRTWLKVNLMHDRSEEVFKLISAVEKTMAGNSLEEVEQKLKQAKEMVSSLDLKRLVSPDVKMDSKYESDALYFFVNLTGTGQNIFKSMSGKLTLENGLVRICQSGRIEDWGQFVAFEKLKTLIDISSSNITNTCSKLDDIYLVSGATLVSGNLPVDLNIKDIEPLYVLRREEIANLKEKFRYKSEQLYEDILKGSKIGYGLFHIADNEPTFCSPITSYSDIHLNLINKQNDIVRFFAPVFDVIEFSQPVESIFKRLQRGTCGIVYASATDLGSLTKALNLSGLLTPEFLPIWIAEVDVDQAKRTAKEALQAQLIEQSAQEQKKKEDKALKEQKIKEQKALREQKIKEQRALEKQRLEKERLLEEQRVKNLRESAAFRQAALRDENDVKFTALTNRLLPGLNNLLGSIGFKASNSALPDNNLKELLSILRPDLLEKKNQGWEKTSLNLEKVDYGVTRYLGRNLEGLVVDIKISMKNRGAGAFEDYCRTLHIAYDLDFDMWRQEKLTLCNKPQQTNKWQVESNFSSKWIVIAD